MGDLAHDVIHGFAVHAGGAVGVHQNHGIVFASLRYQFLWVDGKPVGVLEHKVGDVAADDVLKNVAVFAVHRGQKQHAGPFVQQLGKQGKHQRGRA